MNRYLISSLRGREDEQEVEFSTTWVFHPGDVFKLDGIRWVVVRVIKKEMKGA